MQFTEKLKTAFAYVAHVFGANNEISDKRLAGIIHVQPELNKGRYQNDYITARYYLKKYPDFDGVNGKMALLVVHPKLSNAQWNASNMNASIPEESEGVVVSLGNFPISECDAMMKSFNAGSYLRAVLPTESANNNMIAKIHVSEVHYGIHIMGDQTTAQSRQQFRERGYN